jgi:hypothetical protein
MSVVTSAITMVEAGRRTLNLRRNRENAISAITRRTPPLIKPPATFREAHGIRRVEIRTGVAAQQHDADQVAEDPEERGERGKRGIEMIIAEAPAHPRNRAATDIMRRPSSCSVVTIDAISAAIAEPARPVTSSAVSTGPSSRTSERPTTAPSEPSAPNRDNDT